MLITSCGHTWGRLPASLLVFVSLVLEAGFHVHSPVWPQTFSIDEDDLEPLTPHVPNAGVTDAHHHAQLTWSWGSNSGFHGVILHGKHSSNGAIAP